MWTEASTGSHSAQATRPERAALGQLPPLPAPHWLTCKRGYPRGCQVAVRFRVGPWEVLTTAAHMEALPLSFSVLLQALPCGHHLSETILAPGVHLSDHEIVTEDSHPPNKNQSLPLSIHALPP